MRWPIFRRWPIWPTSIRPGSAVDNCFCTPVLQKPLQLGADIIIHQVSGRLGPLYWRRGAGVFQADGRSLWLPAIRRLHAQSFNAWVFLKGLETLPLRMKAQRTGTVAGDLAARAAVDRKYFYCGSPDHPGTPWQSGNSLDSVAWSPFTVRGRAEAWAFINHTRWVFHYG